MTSTEKMNEMSNNIATQSIQTFKDLRTRFVKERKEEMKKAKALKWEIEDAAKEEFKYWTNRFALHNER